MKNLILALLMLGALGISTRAVSADEATCRRYARDAVADQRTNEARRCELRGDPWSADEQGHFNWCLGASAADLARENRNRSSNLAKCDRCADYANAARDAQRTNLSRRCGFTGNRWSEDERNHYRWCTRVPKRDAEREAGARDLALLNCRH